MLKPRGSQYLENEGCAQPGEIPLGRVHWRHLDDPSSPSPPLSGQAGTTAEAPLPPLRGLSFGTDGGAES